MLKSEVKVGIYCRLSQDDGTSYNCRLSFYMKLIINNIIKINEESPSNNLAIL